MAKHHVRLVITDLDNTLYDWVSSFVPAFYAMVCVAADLLRVSEEQLLDDFRTVHQTHGNSEHPFALLETKSSLLKFGTSQVGEAREYLDPAFHEFNRVRKRTLKIYDTVEETLAELVTRGVDVVAHTDARIHNAMFRLSKLGLVGDVKALYAPAHKSTDLEDQADSEQEDSHTGFVKILPPQDRKPNPRVIADICSIYGIAPQQTLYVGDSLSRDVFMAKNAGAVSAWARYGTEFDPKLWEKLVRVTHWTDDDVKADAELRERSRGTTPDITLDQFGQVLSHCSFSPTADVAEL